MKVASIFHRKRESKLQFITWSLVLILGGHPAEGGSHALGRWIRHCLRHHRPGKLWGGGATSESPWGGQEAEERPFSPGGKQVGPGPRQAGWHRGRGTSGSWNGVRLLRVFCVRRRGWHSGRGFPRAVPRGEAPQGRAGQGQAPQLHHARQTGHQQDADQDQQLGKRRARTKQCIFVLM